MNAEQKPESLNDETKSSIPLSSTKTTQTSDDRTIIGSVGAEEASLEVGESIELVEESDELLQVGQKIGKYEVRAKLGQGGMGAVFLGYDPMIEREVAIKVLPPQVASDQSLLDRFLAEAKAIGKLTNEHVVSIYDIGQHGDLYYIVMELLRGGSLSDVLTKEGVRSWQEACRLIAEAADGLASAHASGLVHRDIKPDNLMLTHEGTVKVVDFGLSKLLDSANDTRDAKTQAGQILGTPQYMSPEQFQGLELDSRSDIYSLGATYYTLLTGKLPYADCASIMQVMYAHLEQDAPDPEKFVDDLPEQCKAIINRAMAKSPEKRYQDVSELSEELMSLVKGPTTESAVVEPLQLVEEYRDLKSAVIAEPSRMQAMVLMDTLKKSGIGSVEICRNANEVLKTVKQIVPDLVVTSMQLPDKNGIDLISKLRSDRSLDRTMLVLNSNDSTMEDLVRAGQTGPMALVSKRTRPAELLQAIHGCTYLEIPHFLLMQKVEPAEIRSLIVCDSDRIPPAIADQIRRLGLVDLQIIGAAELASKTFSPDSFDLGLVLRTAGDAAQDTLLYSSLVTQIQSIARVCGAVQVDGDQITLRTVKQGEYTAVTRCPLDDVRMTRLLELSSR